MKIETMGLAAILAASGAVAEPAGLRLWQIDMPHHGAPAGVSVWYPSAGGGALTRFGENGVFHGVDVLSGAQVLDGAHPIVLFSHGMGGTVRSQAWLASGLAERGAVVVAVDHPNSTWGDFDMRDGVKHWTRAQDLSAALDALLAAPDFAGRIDPDRIMASGFSYGGWTALSLGGVTGNHAGIVATCEVHIDTMSACDMLLSEDVQMQALDPELWNARYADARIDHVVAIDPGFVWGLEPPNVEGLAADTLMIGFGSPDERMSATDFEKSGLRAHLPQARVEQFAPGFHFTAMPLCKPQGAAILQAEQDDPVCTDPEGTDRAAVHAAIIDLMSEALGL